MTITYSLDVANTRFFGLTKLLRRWKGSIYKILWKEFLVFVLGYAALSVTYRLLLDEKQKRQFENWVLYFEAFIELIPLSFVLGFYVSLVVGRWWKQFDAIPWPDKLCYLIGIYVEGEDERGRLIRRNLGRYLILLQVLTYQCVSTAVKRRFPTSQHLVAAGIMTKEERTIFEKLEAPHGKWWLPAQWFSALAVRAKKEGRIKDSILLDGLFREFNKYRNCCEAMFLFDWISVPLVYTQVVTLATYTYAVALMVGRQYLDPAQNYEKHKVDYYVPFVTLLQFFFYTGWLKVAEQIINPYGEDDDDFELNYTINRSCHVVHLLVDHFHMKHPKLRKDIYWDEILPQLPQTKISAKYIKNPQLGSAFNLEVNPADAEFLPMDSVLEEECKADMYPTGTVKQSAGLSYRPSFLATVLNSQFLQNIRRRSTKPEITSQPVSPAFSSNLEKFVYTEGTPTGSQKSSKTRSSSVPKAENILPNSSLVDGSKPMEVPDQGNEADSSLSQMQTIPEELSRLVSTVKHVDGSNINSPSDKLDNVQNLVAAASNVLDELNRVVNSPDSKKERELKGYESCCSLDSDDSEIDSDSDLPQDAVNEGSVAIDMNAGTIDHKANSSSK